ncbi:hypothetical protein C8R46DRAFT_1235556 [Mycena filopes]|nr:hypothetical protein C8R46DRAFT_1235556 [Mycena filopes]
MAYLGDLQFVSPTKHLPANPHLRDPPAYMESTAPPSVASGQTTLSQKVQRNKLLRLGQFCAVTGSASAAAKASYFLNTVRRRKDELARDAKQRIQAIEACLTRLGILGSRPFVFNSLNNLILLRLDLHLSWNEYALFTFVPSLSAIAAVSGHFRACNRLWQEKADAEQKVPAQRPVVESSMDSLQVSELELYILNARDMLGPGGQPVMICANPPYLDADHPSPTQLPTPVWEQFQYSPTTSQLVNNSDEPRTVPILHGQLFIVAVILNADAILAHAALKHWDLHAYVDVLRAAIQLFKDQFFFIPSVQPTADTSTSGTGLEHEISNITVQDAASGKDSEYEGGSGGQADEETKLALEKIFDSSVPIEDRQEMMSNLVVKRPTPLSPYRYY